MDLTTLSNTLRGQAENSGYITLDDAVLGTSDLDSLIENDLGRTEGNIILYVNAGDFPNNPSGSFTVEGYLPPQASQSFLNLLNNNCAVTFSQSGSMVNLTLLIDLEQAADQPVSWNFGESYASLTYMPVSELPATGQTFTFVSSEMPGGLSPGLNYEATVALTGPFTPTQVLLRLMGYHVSEVAIAGKVTGQGPSFQIGGQFPGVAPLDLGTMVLENPGVAYASSLIRSPEDSSKFVPSITYSMCGMVEIASTDGTPAQIEVIGTLPVDGQAEDFRINLLPVNPVDTSIANLGSLVGFQGWNELFTGSSSQLLNYLGSFALKAYSMELDLRNLNVGSSLLLAGATANWEIVPGYINLENFDVQWLLFDPLENGRNMITLSARVTLFEDYTFFGYITIPDMYMSLQLDSPVTMPIGDWLDVITNGFGVPSVPQNIKDTLNTFSIGTFVLNYDYQNSNFNLSTNGSIVVLGQELDFSVLMNFNEQNGEFTYDILGAIGLAGATFSAEFVDDGTTTGFTVSFTNEDNPLQIAPLIASFGLEVPSIPSDLDLALKAFTLRYTIDDVTPANTRLVVEADSANWGKAVFSSFQYQGSWAYYFGLDINKPINLSNLPLVDQVLSPDETIAIQDITVILASSAVTPEMVPTFTQHVDAGYPVIPAQGMSSPIGISVTFNFAGYLVPLSLGFANTQVDNGRSTADSTTQGTSTGDANAAVPAASPATSDGTTWFNVQKSIGPVDIEAVGVRYVDNVLWFLLTAQISMAGLSISMDGLAVGSPLDTFEPEFNLDGLGIDYSTPAFEVGGALLNMRLTPPDFEYAGMLVARVMELSLGVAGAYGQIDGNATMFLFGQLSGLALGQPYFMVKGFSGGFGYNSSLRIPGLAEVFQFPMVAGLTNPSAMGGANATPMEALNILMGAGGSQTAWVTPEVGQYWIAAGMEVSSFDLINLNALAVVEFGNDLSVALIGLATAKFPPEGPVTYASVELQVMASYSDAEGVLLIGAQLSPNSYLLDPAARLTGGFAFDTWFRGEHAGDFVLSIGGYNPNFNLPAWYPAVPRVGFSWSLDSLVSITGGAYLAMTPACIMAGGNLDVKFQDGGLKAWLTANADMIIWYQPFNFQVEVGVTVGVSYTMDTFFTNKTITAEVGANLSLWGPPTGGTVNVYWWVLSFTIDFGAKLNEVESKSVADWNDFASLLPPAGKTSQVNAVTGMVGQAQPSESAKQVSSGNDSQPAWIIARDGFSFQTTSAVPATQIYLGMNSTTPFQTGNAINILPMQAQNLQSTQRIYLVKTDSNEEIDLSGWTVTPVTQNVPAALWGSGTTKSIPRPDAQLVKDQYTGIKVTAPTATKNASTGAIEQDKLAFTDLDLNPADPLATNQPPSGEVPEISQETILIIASEIDSSTTTSNRNALYIAVQVLGFDPGTNASMSQFADEAGQVFSKEPMIIDNQQ